jgi:hypothetical protein
VTGHVDHGLFLVSKAMGEDEQDRVNNEAQASNNYVARVNDKRIEALSQEWYNTNKEWADNPAHKGEGWDGTYGAKDKLASASDHRKLNHRERAGDG